MSNIPKNPVQPETTSKSSTSFNPIRNIILRTYYPNIQTLYEYLSIQCGGEKIKLICKDDNSEYKTFLETSAISITTDEIFPKNTLGIIRNNNKFEYVLDSVIKYLVARFDSRTSISNVLTLGFTKPRTNSNPKGFSIQYDNSTTDHIRRSPVWNELFQRLGEDVMEYILRNASIFIALNHKSYIQILGNELSAINLMNQALSTTAKSPFTLRMPSTSSAVAQSSNALIQSEQNSKMEDIELLNKEDSQISQEDLSFEQQDKNLSQDNSTWFTSSQETICEIVEDPILPDPNLKRPFEHLESQDNLQNKAIKIKNGEKAKITSRSNIFFGRHNMFFYNSGYNSNCDFWFGLPKNHILNVVKSSKGPNILDLVACHIFPRQFGLCNVFDNPQTDSHKLFKLYMYRSNEIEESKLQVPSRLKKLFPLLNKLIHQHKRCRYDVLLNRFCPKKCDPLTETDFSSNAHQVFAFVKEAIRQVIPCEFWECENQKIIHKAIEKFILLRQHEMFSLHEAMDKFQIKKCKWLEMEGVKNNKVEADKRVEILNEFIWWLFESFVIPLLRSSFYITTNATFKYRVFYYRHDIWYQVVQKGINSLTKNIFKEIPVENEEELQNGTLGYSTIRLLPKDNEGAVRPINNLKRPIRNQVIHTKTNRRTNQSVNTILKDTFHILNFEKDDYALHKYDVVKCEGNVIRTRHNHDFANFMAYAKELSRKFMNGIIVDRVKETYIDKKDVLGLLEEHLKNNLIKIGNKFYKQAIGIPQGSVVSTLLCSFYYGAMEWNELPWVKNNDGEKVVKFITAMHKVNFDLKIDDTFVTKLEGSLEFPWCGLLIHTKTLNCKADYQRYGNSLIADSLTIKTAKNPGELLKNKMIEATVLLNIYQNFLITAMKFHYYVKGLPHRGIQRNETFEWAVVKKTFESTYKVIQSKSQTQKIDIQSSEIRCELRRFSFEGFDANQLLSQMAGNVPESLETIKIRMVYKDIWIFSTSSLRKFFEGFRCKIDIPILWELILVQKCYGKLRKKALCIRIYVYHVWLSKWI
ncbi:9743_t:CDS:10 [Diversispora eburnea]|uniref:Telomerase reverse transcriptase n=1 Tax=Diversispora eburnea TaxID=1213867 RepID=A0A9N9AF34_9GLOM|nr:9743_t:CDS:10 [Diversispora eburnea]